MISYMEGEVVNKGSDRLVVRVGGMGFEVRAPAGTVDRAPAAGGKVTLHTYLHVRQDVLQLYGFDSARARDLFMKLMTVSGFGSAKALSVLSVFSPEGFERVVQSGAADELTIIPGVGKKGAERLLLEMKDKVEPTADDLSGIPEGGLRPFQEAASALVQLGYSRPEAGRLLKAYPLPVEDATVEQMLQWALKNAGRGDGR